MTVLSLSTKQKYGTLLGPNSAFMPGSYESIATVSVGSGGTSYAEFTSIPSTYSHLQIRTLQRDTGTPANMDNLYLQFNGDTGTNYSYHRLIGTGSSVLVTSDATISNLKIGLQPNAGITANAFGTSIIDILDYANTSKYKTVRTLVGSDTNDTNGNSSLFSGNWRNTNAITSIKIYPEANNFAQYSRFALYGIKVS